MGTRDERKRPFPFFVSIRTSMGFFVIFALLLVVGWFFRYDPGANRFHWHSEYIMRFADFGDLPAFLGIAYAQIVALTVLLFLLHLILCLGRRFNNNRKRPSFRLFTREDLLQRDYSFSLSRPAEAGELDIEKVLRTLGFGKPRYYSEDARARRVVCEKGLPFKWLSWLYHICILLVIVAAILRYFYPTEEYLKISIGEQKVIVSDAPAASFSRLMALWNDKEIAPPTRFEVLLENFTTELAESPALQYQRRARRDSLIRRIVEGDGLTYSSTESIVYPRNWISVLNIYEDGKSIGKEEVEVNAPCRYKGVKFYQIGCEYEFDLQAGGEVLTGIPVGKTFTIPQMEGEFRLRNPHIGILYKDEERVPLSLPWAELEHRPPSAQAGARWSSVGKLVLQEPSEVMHAEMVLTDLRESSILSYRYDPGRPFLLFAFAAMLVVMVLRLYCPWYQVRCHTDDSAGHSLVTVSIRMMGLLARPERMKQKISQALLD